MQNSSGLVIVINQMYIARTFKATELTITSIILSDRSYVIVIILSRLEPNHVIMIGIVETNSIAVVVESAAGAIVSIFTALVNM